jgi:uncharacterized protein YecE (DUF72 family)
MPNSHCGWYNHRGQVKCLGEYCQYQDQGELITFPKPPLFRTVGNDSTFYRPPTANQLRHYLTQIPEDFQMCFKVWEEITIPTYSNHVRYGVRAGQPNPRFLDAKLFEAMVLGPYREAKFEPHTGAFLFEFQRHGMPAEEFCSRLDQFFLMLPREFRYAVEVRNPGLLGMPYSLMLSRHGVAHVYNHWDSMPFLADQHTRMQGFTAAFTVLRLLTPLGMSYAAAKQRAEPYTKIVEELPQMRRETAQLVRQAVGAGRRVYVLVNNRAEGNAPLTVEALVAMLRS